MFTPNEGTLRGAWDLPAGWWRDHTNKGGRKMDIVQAISGFLLGLAFVLPFLIKTKAVLKEVKDVLVTVDAALDDNSISLEEAKSVLKELKDIPGVFAK